MSSGGSAPSSSARLSRLYVASAASMELRATSRFPCASTTDQYWPTACKILLLTWAAKLARDCQRRLIGEKPAIFQERLRELKIESGIDRRIENASRSEAGVVEGVMAA